jgi:hypothetical protein
MCADVWGAASATPNLICDEYPMASDREGAYTGSGGTDGDSNGWQTWHGSARLIGEVDNQDSGRLYLNNGFYPPQRIIDGEAFFVAIVREHRGAGGLPGRRRRPTRGCTDEYVSRSRRRHRERCDPGPRHRHRHQR